MQIPLRQALPCRPIKARTSTLLTTGARLSFFTSTRKTPRRAAPRQAIAFRDHQAAFKDANAVILGVSKDSIKKHQNFVAKQELSFALGSDEHSDVCESFGVWKEKSMYGKTYMGIERSTFVIDGNGNIAKSWHKVKVPGHVEEVLAFVQTLTAG